MSYSIKLTDEAKEDIQNIFNFYKSEKAGLEKDFLGQLNNIFKLLENNPNLFQIKYRNLRQAPLKKFPIQVHYFIEEPESQVIVIAALHSSRDPKTWRDR